MSHNHCLHKVRMWPRVFCSNFVSGFSLIALFLIEKNMEKVLVSKMSVMGCGWGEPLLLG